MQKWYTKEKQKSINLLTSYCLHIKEFVVMISHNGYLCFPFSPPPLRQAFLPACVPLPFIAGFTSQDFFKGSIWLSVCLPLHSLSLYSKMCKCSCFLSYMLLLFFWVLLCAWLFIFFRAECVHFCDLVSFSRVLCYLL